MRYAIINQGTVSNIIEVDDAEFAASIGAVSAPDGVSIGWAFNGSEFEKPTVEAPDIPQFEAALGAHYDAIAAQRRYSNRYTCAMRAGYPGPFHDEGMAFATWMDSCNAYAYGVLAAVQSGQRMRPSNTADLIAELPAMVWPN